MLIIFITILAVNLSAAVAAAGELLNAQAWQSSRSYPSSFDFPESKLLDSKPNTAVGFSGGGARAYLGALGALSALHKLDLIKNIRYVGGISGGSWATTTYSFAQNIEDDDTFLGSVVPPSEIFRDDLSIMHPDCARGFASADFVPIALNALSNGEVQSIADAWCLAVSQVYLEPVGVKPGTRFSWNQDTVDDIKSRNPHLSEEPFVFPVMADRPYPVIGATLVGPAEGAPFGPASQNYTMTEFTPLYVGQMRTLDVAYSFGNDASDVHVKRVGGAVEPFAFGSGAAGGPAEALSEGQTSGILQVPAPQYPIDLAHAAGASGYATGSFFESINIPKMARDLSMEFDYWSPSGSASVSSSATNEETRYSSGKNDLKDVEPKPHTSEVSAPVFSSMMFSDGGSFENIPFIEFLQRDVSKIVLFYHNSVPLQPFENWNVSTDPYSESQIAVGLSSFFGALGNEREARWENRTDEYEMNQVFATADYERVVVGLQTAQAEGRGIIATFNLTTVENAWWGIPAGQQVEVTFSYLGRLAQWEQQLSTEMRALVVPKEDADDLSVDIQEGPFKGFPHYFTSGGLVNYERANLLADLVGWSVLQHEKTFRRMLS